MQKADVAAVLRCTLLFVVGLVAPACSAHAGHSSLDAGSDAKPGAVASEPAVPSRADTGPAGAPAPAPAPPPAPPLVNLLDVLGLAWGNDLFVAVAIEREDGDSPWQGSVYTSKDGFDWKLSTLDGRPLLSDVAFGNGVFVAVEQRAAGLRSCVSVDGADWACRPPVQGDPSLVEQSDVNRRPRSLAFGNGVFMLAHRVANQVLTSKDGVTWSGVAKQPVFENFGCDGAEFGAGVFVVWGGIGIVASADGAEWTFSMLEAPYPSIDSVYGSASGFVGEGTWRCCFGELGGPWFGLLESSNGANWTYTSHPYTTMPITVPVFRDDGVCIEIIQPSGSNPPRTQAGSVAAGTTCGGGGVVVGGYALDPVAVLHAGGVYILAGGRGLIASKDGLHFQSFLVKDALKSAQ